MKSTLYGLATCFATTSIALAGGGGEGDKPTTAGEPLSLLQNVSVSAAAGQGVTITSGDDFSINIRNGAQFNWAFSAMDVGADTSSFGMKRARTMLEGNVYNSDITYYVELRWEGGANLLEGYADWAFWHGDNEDAISLRVGRQRVRHGREFETHWSQLEHTNRSLASNTFSGNRIMGAFLRGQHLENGALQWTAGAGNNDAALATTALEGSGFAANADNELNFFVSGRFDPWGSMEDSQADLAGSEEWRAGVGASIMVGNHRVAAASPDVESTDININIAGKGNGFHALGEIFIRSDDVDGGVEADSTGWAVGGSYTLPPAEEGGSQWGFAVRLSMVDLDDAPVLLTGTALGAAAGDITEIEGTISNYYREHNLKTQVNFKHQTVDPTGPGDADNDFIEVLFQWMF